MNNIIPRGQISTILLSCLTDGDKYGSELLQELQKKSDNQVTIKQPTLYSTLSRMEKQGYISSYWRDSTIGGKRHYYRLTDLGKKFLTDNENKVLANFVIDEKNDKKNITKSAVLEKPNEQILTQKVSIQSYKENSTPNQDLLLKPNQNSFFENLKKSRSNTKTVTTKDDGIFLPPKKDSQKNITKSASLENHSMDNTLKKIESQDKDMGVFVTEKLLPEQIPKVKKIDAVNIDVVKGDDLQTKLKTTKYETEMDKIEALYQKTKSIGISPIDVENLESTQSEETLDGLANRYENMNIQFYANNANNQEIINLYNKIPSKYLFAKYFTIFLLALVESVGIWLIYFLSQGAVDYAIAYIIIPILFALPAIYFLFSRKKERKYSKSSSCLWVSIMIFIMGVILIYCLNLFLGITFSTILNFETTFVYPAVLLTNVLIAGIFDHFLIKKFK